MRPHFLTLLAFMCCGLGLAAQTHLSLPTCLETAVENNLSLRQTANNLTVSEVTVIQKKFAFLPSVAGGVSLSKSFGTSVDNFTQQIANSPLTGSPNLGASVALFQGMSKWNDLKAAQYSLEAADYSLEDLKNDIRLNVALAFFQVIFSEDQAKLAEERVALLGKQLEKAEAQLAAGVKTEGDVFAIRAQAATEKVNQVQQNNTYQRNLLNLLQAMNLDPMEPYILDRPDISAMETDPGLPSLESIRADAFANNPGLRARAMDALSKKYALSSTKATYYPTLSLSYGMGSFYSSNNRPVVRIDPGPNGTFIFVYGDPTPLDKQLSNNFGQNLSLNLNVPIFSNYNLKSAVVASRVRYENAILAEEIEGNDLFKAIQQAYWDYNAARAQLDATKEQIENVRKSYEYAELRHEAGMLDFYTLIDVLNTKTRAETSLFQARYDFVLKKKVVELYQGKTLQF